jgi:hypothetical protein
MTPPAKPLTPPVTPSLTPPIVPYKRCPNGTRRNKTTGKCEPKDKKPAVAPEPPMLAPEPPMLAPVSPIVAPVRYKRCPNGTRRNKITGLCEPR